MELGEEICKEIVEKAKRRFEEFMRKNVEGLPAPLAMAKVGSELFRSYIEIEFLKLEMRRDNK